MSLSTNGEVLLCVYYDKILPELIIKLRFIVRVSHRAQILAVFGDSKFGDSCFLVGKLFYIFRLEYIHKICRYELSLESSHTDSQIRSRHGYG
jgi:hypothetical protein